MPERLVQFSKTPPAIRRVPSFTVCTPDTDLAAMRQLFKYKRLFSQLDSFLWYAVPLKAPLPIYFIFSPKVIFSMLAQAENAVEGMVSTPLPMLMLITFGLHDE